MVYPFRRIRRGFVGFQAVSASITEATPAEMLTAEEQTAPAIASIGLAAANIAESPVDLSIAVGIIARCRHAVANIALPLGVISNRPSHRVILQDMGYWDASLF